MAEIKNPFKQAKVLEKRLKLFLWGNTGVGKTPISLQFPDPVMLDLDGGSIHYADQWKFGVKRNVESYDVFLSDLHWLATAKHEYKTLIIDPITFVWDMIQSKWSDLLLKQARASGKLIQFRGLEISDWRFINKDWGELIRLLHAIDMNIICIARETEVLKVSTAGGKTTFTVDGIKADCQKNIAYEFDTVIHMEKEKGENHAIISRCSRDRTRKIKTDEDFVLTYHLLQSMIGKEVLERDVKQLNL